MHFPRKMMIAVHAARSQKKSNHLEAVADTDEAYESPKKNLFQFPFELLNARKTYTDVVKFPKHITNTVHTKAVIALSSRRNIHREKRVKPTYRSTRETTPQGCVNNQSSSSLPFPFTAAYRITLVMNTAPNAETHWPICKACFVVIAVVRAVVVLEALGNMCSEALSIAFYEESFKRFY